MEAGKSQSSYSQSLNQQLVKENRETVSVAKKVHVDTKILNPLATIRFQSLLSKNLFKCSLLML